MDYFRIKEKRSLTRASLAKSLKDHISSPGEDDDQGALEFIYGLANLAVKIQLRNAKRTSHKTLKAKS